MNEEEREQGREDEYLDEMEREQGGGVGLDRVGAFLFDLEQLALKHRLRIVDESCGCCGHTALVDVDTDVPLLSVDDWTDTRLRVALR